jgi:hypothetical protein
MNVTAVVARSNPLLTLMREIAMNLRHSLGAAIFFIAGCASQAQYAPPAPSEEFARAIPTQTNRPWPLVNEITWISEVDGARTWNALITREFYKQPVVVRPGQHVITVMYSQGKIDVSAPLRVTVRAGQTVLAKSRLVASSSNLDRLAGKDHVFVWLEDQVTGQELTEQVPIFIRY